MATETLLLLLHEDVERVVSMRDAIGAIEQACKEQSTGGVIIGERQNLRFPGGWVRLMCAAMTQSGVFGYKEFHLTEVDGCATPTAFVRYTTHLFDSSDGRPLAAIDANYLTLLRTGAAAALAADRLASPEATDLAVIGSGAEARSQLEAVLAVRPISAVRVYGRDPDRRSRFAHEMTERFKVDIRTVPMPQDAIRGADIVIAATLTDGTPALLGEWLEPGQHVTFIGSTMPSQREIDVDVWRRADRIVVDTLDLLEESGDGLAAVRAGAVDRSRIRELSDLVASGLSARTSESEITLYKSVGTAMQDLAVAALAYQQALANDVGTRVKGLNSVKTVRPN